MQVTFLHSVQGHQVERVRAFAERLRKAHPELTVAEVEGDAATAALAQHKLRFGPAIVVDGRVEYVGIPRWRFLQERIAQVAGGVRNPRSSVQPEKAAPARPAAPAAKPSGPAQPEKPAPAPSGGPLA